MKKYFICLSVTLLHSLIAATSFAQNLTMHHTFGGTRFEYHKDTSTFTVSPKQVSDIMQDDPLAAAEFKKARSNYSAAGVFGFVGGALICFPLGTAIAGGEPEWGLAVAGAAFIFTSIPLSKAFRRHAEEAVDLYNKKHTAFRPRTELFLSGLGGRVVIKF